MKFYISTTGIKRVTISSSGSAVKGSPPTATASRRIPSRTLLPVVLLLGIALPFLFVRIAFLVLESAAACSSPLDCIGWRFFTGDDASMKLREELTGALVEATTGNVNEEQIESFNELVKDMTSKGHDIKTFAFKTKAMVNGLGDSKKKILIKRLPQL